MDPTKLIAMFEESRNENKGLMLFLPGHSLAIVVTEIHGTSSVEGRNQEYDRIVIRTDQILALAFQ